MRYILLILLSLPTFANTTNPRETFRTFLKAMVQVKLEIDVNDNYERAIKTLDLSKFSAPANTIGRKLSNDLIQVLDKIKKVDYEKIPTAPDSPYWNFDKRAYQGRVLEISLIKKGEDWLFSYETFESLDYYQESLKNVDNIEGVETLNRFQDKIQSWLPEKFQGSIGKVKYWQIFGLVLIVIVGLILQKISHSIIEVVVKNLSKIAHDASTNKLDKAIDPLTNIFFVYFCMKMIFYLNFTPKMMITIERVLLIAMSFMAVWFGHRVVELLSFYASQKAEATDSRFDDIIVPLLTKTSFVIVYMVGAIIVASAFTIDVTGLIAGLGIGGLAFAFAAKDTLANFFGSIMLVLDRPFDIGDVIDADGIVGIVEEVGFRSTRIRTFNDSLITISNGNLMNRSIDNMGKRRFRRLNTTLGVEYGTPAAKIEAFCEGIRQLILSHKWTRKDSFHVYFDGFGASSLDIKLMVYWETDDYARELAERHRLNVDIMRLAKEMGINFAFPTQTLHVINQAEITQEDLPDKYFEVGMEKAKTVASKPLSLKNPRSNAQDENQFGKNDVGI
tara:strand:+ start:2326 stop:4005 length:1680 start_codon:yes stop_codon:yes gene_type:complete